jgi:hypothetical protein
VGGGGRAVRGRMGPREARGGEAAEGEPWSSYRMIDILSFSRKFIFLSRDVGRCVILQFESKLLFMTVSIITCDILYPQK